MGGIIYNDEKHAWIIGYNLRRDMWGKGIAVEAMKAITGHVRSIRPVYVIEGQFCKENQQSRRVMVFISWDMILSGISKGLLLKYMKDCQRL